MEITVQVILSMLTNSWLNFVIILLAGQLSTLSYRKLIMWCLWIGLSITWPSNLVIPGLQNMLASIHPILILSAYSWYLVRWGSKSTIRYNLYCASTLWLALYLGAWWAFQEFTWGGWWNWDSVEVPVLVIALVMTYNGFHSKQSSCHAQEAGTQLQLTLILLAIYCTRFLNSGSVHSFVTSQDCYNEYLSIWVFFIARAFVLSFGLVAKSFTWVSLVSWIAIVILIRELLVSFNAKFKQTNTLHYQWYLLVFFTVSLNWNYSDIFSPPLIPQNYHLDSNLWVKPQTLTIWGGIKHLTILTN